MKRENPKSFRCAIYTRVSTDSGLEQDFNSLDAQREAAEAFIKSQAHEGWKLIPTEYDDGGFSGGTLDRPAMGRLLDDIRAKRVDVVLVYKVDRLTRSLADFAKLVELFDANGVSFVSVTQAFNTTSSMGRLTLNVLLSFAQFEREVTAERIRDKFAASKKNGMWMGGSVPLGYRVDRRKLLIEEKDAETVRQIFDCYLEQESTIKVLEELRRRSIRTKVRTLKDGRIVGGVPFTIGPLLYLLKNRTYVGEISHRDNIYVGEHPPLLDRSIFEAVQEKLNQNLVVSRISGASNAPLLGLIFDDRGNLMSPSHAQKGPRRYYYYTSRAFIEGRREEAGSVPRVAARDIEPKILAALNFLPQAQRGIRPDDDQAESTGRWLIRKLVDRVVLGTDCIQIHLKADLDPPSQELMLEVPWKRKLARLKREILFSQSEGRTVERPIKAKARKSLVKAIARGRVWLQELAAGKVRDIEAIARREGRCERSVSMTLSLAFLAPDIVEAAVMGSLPRGFGITKLMNLPPTWRDQRSALSG